MCSAHGEWCNSKVLTPVLPVPVSLRAQGRTRSSPQTPEAVADPRSFRNVAPRIGDLVVTFCRNIRSVFPRFPVFSGHEIRILRLPEMRLIILKRKELTDRSGKT